MFSDSSHVPIKKKWYCILRNVASLGDCRSARVKITKSLLEKRGNVKQRNWLNPRWPKYTLHQKHYHHLKGEEFNHCYWAEGIHDASSGHHLPKNMWKLGFMTSCPELGLSSKSPNSTLRGRSQGRSFKIQRRASKQSRKSWGWKAPPSLSDFRWEGNPLSGRRLYWNPVNAS